MLRQNWKSSILLLLMSVSSFSIGAYLWHIETIECQQRYLQNIEYQLRQSEIDVAQRIRFLFAIKQGRIDELEKYFQLSVRSDLKQPSINLVDLPTPELNHKVIEKAVEYQAKYCSDACLGVE